MLDLQLCTLTTFLFLLFLCLHLPFSSLISLETTSISSRHVTVLLIM